MTEATVKPKRESARDVLINAAEHLFGTIGFDGVSTRQILDFAGQKNQSALQYHFGGRQGLIWAVLEARLSIVEEDRQRVVEQLPPSGEESVEQLAEAFIRPLAEFVCRDERGSAFVQFNNQAIHRPDFDLVAVTELGKFWALKEIWDRLDHQLSHVPEQEVSFRKNAALSIGIGTIAVWDRTGKGNVSLDDFVRTAVGAIAAVIAAPARHISSINENH